MPIDDLIFPPVLWRFRIGVGRVALAATALSAAFLFPTPLSAPRRAVLIAYLAYACLVVSRKSFRRFSGRTEGLGADGAFLLACAGVGIWLCTAAFAFLLATGMLLHRWVALLLTIAVSLPLVLAIQTQDAYVLAPGLTAASLLAMLAAWQKHLLCRSAIYHRPVAPVTAVEQAVEAERQRLAADFHDGPLQSFAGFQMRLEVIRMKLERDPAAAMQEVLDLQAVANAQAQEIRAFVRNIGVFDLQDGDFHRALQRVVKDFRQQSGIETSFEGADSIDHVGASAASEIPKIVREALHNAQKHAKATRISLKLKKTPNAVEMQITDNGVGFPFSGEYTLDELDAEHLGPQSIKRRIRALGGDLHIESHPGASSTLRITLPE